jgi:hypothetical protein
LESILDLLYNEDYYYLESSTPYLPPPEDDSSSEKTGGSGDAEGDSSKASFASTPTHGQSIKWNETEKISMDKYKVKIAHIKFRTYQLTSCSKSADKLSTSCVGTACPKLSTSMEQAVTVVPIEAFRKMLISSFPNFEEFL